MARRVKTPEILLEAAEKSMAEAQTAQEIRAAQSVLLPALFGMSLQQTAEALGVSRASVVRLRKTYTASLSRERGQSDAWGGRRRSYLSVDEERQFLAEYLETTRNGGILSVNEVKKAFELKVGHEVARTTVYRMLGRHGWRKSPRCKHPGTVSDGQKAFAETD